MILIVGPSGAVGLPLIQELLRKNTVVRALSSSDASAAYLRDLGVADVVRGDFRNTNDVKRAMSGVDNVCLIPPRFQEDELDIGKRVVDAAVGEGVSHFLFSSAYHAQMEDLGHHWQKLRLEEYLINTDLMVSVVQPSMFMQNIHVEWPKVLETGLYARPYSPDSLMNVIDTGDLAAAMARILLEPAFQGASYELCGADLLSHTQMAEIISGELGRKVTAVQRDLSDWQAWARDRNWTVYAIETYSAMCRHYDTHGYKYGNDITLKAILGRPPTTYRDFIRRFVAANTS